MTTGYNFNKELKNNIGMILSVCLQELVEVRPRDPIFYISQWLYKYANNRLYYEHKASHFKTFQAKVMELEKERALKIQKDLELEAELMQLKGLLPDEGTPPPMKAGSLERLIRKRQGKDRHPKIRGYPGETLSHQKILLYARDNTTMGSPSTREMKSRGNVGTYSSSYSSCSSDYSSTSLSSSYTSGDRDGSGRRGSGSSRRKSEDREHGHRRRKHGESEERDHRHKTRHGHHGHDRHRRRGSHEDSPPPSSHRRRMSEPYAKSYRKRFHSEEWEDHDGKHRTHEKRFSSDDRRDRRDLQADDWSKFNPGDRKLSRALHADDHGGADRGSRGRSRYGKHGAWHRDYLENQDDEPGTGERRSRRYHSEDRTESTRKDDKNHRRSGSVDSKRFVDHRRRESDDRDDFDEAGRYRRRRRHSDDVDGPEENYRARKSYRSDMSDDEDERRSSDRSHRYDDIDDEDDRRSSRRSYRYDNIDDDDDRRRSRRSHRYYNIDDEYDRRGSRRRHYRDDIDGDDRDRSYRRRSYDDFGGPGERSRSHKRQYVSSFDEYDDIDDFDNAVDDYDITYTSSMQKIMEKKSSKKLRKQRMQRAVCTWFLRGSPPELVCFHPVLGYLRAPHRQRVAVERADRFWGTVRYACEVLYDQEIYTVCDPHADDELYYDSVARWNGRTWILKDKDHDEN